MCNCKPWDQLHINWCRISSINSTKGLSTSLLYCSPNRTVPGAAVDLHHHSHQELLCWSLFLGGKPQWHKFLTNLYKLTIKMIQQPAWKGPGIFLGDTFSPKSPLKSSQWPLLSAGAWGYWPWLLNDFRLRLPLGRKPVAHGIFEFRTKTCGKSSDENIPQTRVSQRYLPVGHSFRTQKVWMGYDSWSTFLAHVT